MFHRIIIASLLCSFTFACSSALSSGRETATATPTPAASPTNTPMPAPSAAPTPQATATLPLPVLPVIAQYEHVPHYFMQWLNDHPQYALIEAAVFEGKPQIFSLTLTEKASGRRVSYCNAEARVKALTQGGQEVRLTKIDYRSTNDFGQLPSHEFNFADERGQAIRWRFTLAAPASERGAGLTPQDGRTGLLLIYRELGTAAGAGTAVQIGDKVSEAEPWTEISAPPYFVAYRGAYSDGIGIGGLFAGQESWRVTAAPKELPKDLNEGAQWTLTDERGRTRQWRITAQRGDELTLQEAGQAMTLQARKTATGLALRSLTFTSRAKTMRLSFAPELDLTATAPVNFQIDQNGQNKLAHGSVTPEKRGNVTTLRWQFKAPDWAKARVMNSTVTMNDNGYKLEVK